MTPDPSFREEERGEVEKHAVLYRDPEIDALRMQPSDWEKFAALQEPFDPYTGSMLRLGPIRGLRVLDAGCGDGWLSVILAKLGAAAVDAFDISDVGVGVARRRAELNGVSSQCQFVAASFYSIPFADASMDIVIGQGILHHLGHKDQAAQELCRVMKPGARAVFMEPFGNLLWLERLRLLVPVASEAPEDPGEWARQFKYRDLEPFRRYFQVQVEEFHLFSRIDRLISSRSVLATVRRLDRTLLRYLPFVRPFARAVVLEMRRPPFA